MRDAHPFQGRTVLVCGGSRGIGLETAREFVLRGSSVCIVARNADDLAAAVADVSASRPQPSQYVDSIACDTTDAERLRPLLDEHVERRGVPDYLVNNVGFAYPEYVHNLSLDHFRRNMDVNYYGQLVPTLLLLPHFMSARKGHIANVSSMLGYMGMMGYAAYAPTKFAIVGLTESLRNELKPHGVSFSVLYPPDTETGGFEKENLTKPNETKLMSGNVKPMSAAAVAKVFVDGIGKREYAIMPGQARMVWRLNRFFPGLVRRVLDREHEKARAATSRTTPRPTKNP
jgi:3-dehydrosphinganine reductase